MSSRAPAIAIACVVVTASIPAVPQRAQPPLEGALEMSAEHLDLDVEAKTAVLTGRVKLTKGAMTVSCPRVDVRYDSVPHVTWAKASGGVVAEVKGVKAQAPDAELDLAQKTLELRGGVRITRGDGWITAERARIDIATAKVSMTDVKGSIPVPRSP